MPANKSPPHSDHKLTFSQIIATKSNCNNDVHQFYKNASTHPHTLSMSGMYETAHLKTKIVVLHKYLNDEQ